MYLELVAISIIGKYLELESLDLVVFSHIDHGYKLKSY